MVSVPSLLQKYYYVLFYTGLHILLQCNVANFTKTKIVEKGCYRLIITKQNLCTTMNKLV